MLRRILVASLALLASAPTFALAHEGNPNFRSEVHAAPAGVTAQVLNYDDSIELIAADGQEVVVIGYDDEPYLRFRPDGTVEVNRRSPAAYLNDDRFAEVEIPPAADPQAPPRWEPVAEHGRYAWHDHRIHYMARGTPPQVADESVETEVFDWELPVEVDGERRTVTGSLTWAPQGGGASLPLLAGLGAAVLASVALAVVRLRRRGGEHDEPDEREAW